MTSSPKVQHLMDFPHADQGFAFRLLELLVIPAFVLDPHGRVIVWNRACERLTGVAGHEIVGTADAWRSFYRNSRPTLADLVIQERTGEIPSLYESLGHPGDDPAHLSAESWCDMPRAGRRRYLAVDVSPIRDEQGRLVAVVETLRDMTEEKQAQIALEQLATRDGLTGLANRRCFDDTLHAEWQRALRQHQPLSLLIRNLKLAPHGSKRGTSPMEKAVWRRSDVSRWLAGDRANSPFIVGRFVGQFCGHI